MSVRNGQTAHDAQNLIGRAATGLTGSAIAIAVLILCSLALYIPSLSYYFAQDDFYFLNRAAHTTGDVFSMFRQYGPFYRPLSTSVYFSFMLNVFGLRPLPYHVVSIGLFCVNGLLVYHVCGVLFRDRTTGFLAALFYVTRGVHFETVSWASGIQDLMMMCFALLSLVFYLRFSQGSRKNIFIALFFFILAAMSKETVFAFPLILLAYELILNVGRLDRMKWVFISAFFVVTAAFVLSRFLHIGRLPARGEYATGFGTFWLSNLAKYFAININIFLLQFTEFPRTFRCSAFVVFFGVIGFLFTEFLARKQFLGLKALTLFRHLSDATERNRRYIVFGLVFFLLGALPALPFKSRIEPYYMSLAGAGMSIALAATIASFSKRRTKVVIMIGICIISFVLNARIREKRLSHVGKFSPAAENAIESLRPVLEGAKPGTTLYILGSDWHLWSALARGDGVKAFFPAVESVIFDISSPGYTSDGSEIVFRYGHERQAPDLADSTLINRPEL